MATIYVSEDTKAKLPKRREHDHYPTNQDDANRLIEYPILNIDTHVINPLWSYTNNYIEDKDKPLDTTFHILDAGAGDFPVFGYAALRAINHHLFKTADEPYVKIDMHAVEIRPESLDKPRNHQDVIWYEQNYLTFDHKPTYGYDLIVGNPPFKYAESFIHKSIELLRLGGRLLFLLPIGLMVSKGRYERLYKKGNKYRGYKTYFVCGRPSFTGDGKVAPQDYVMLELIKDENLQPKAPDWFLL